MSAKESHANELRETLQSKASSYSLKFSPAQLDGLTNYYELLQTWNSRLHLVAPTSAQEFATRHILESLLLLEHLPTGARVADVGSGAGLPIIPCLIVRPDIRAVLIEASKKKSVFLREALRATTSSKAAVIADRFEDTTSPEVEFITSRALERFETMIPRLLEWAPSGCKLLLFGGQQLKPPIETSGYPTSSILLPNTRQRFLFLVSKP
jgi:16S rRNA (guanine527-N7)-methyltransferase